MKKAEIVHTVPRTIEYNADTDTKHEYNVQHKRVLHQLNASEMFRKIVTEEMDDLFSVTL